MSDARSAGTLTRRYSVSGRVQGVAFRAATRMRAQQLAINGHARNLADGTVEVLACGSPEALAALETFLRRGPSLARVAAVAVSEANAQPPFGFRIG